MTPHKPSSTVNQKSALRLLFRERELLVKNRIQLLAKIEETGSLSRAAKAVKLSYKSAWDTIDALNNIAEKPLVTKETGGRKGGGSFVTEYGREILRTYHRLETEYNSMNAQVGAGFNGFLKAADLLDKLTFKISARNQFYGTVEKITEGVVNTEVTLRIGSTLTLAAMLTYESVKILGLKKGTPALAVFKASAPIIVAADRPLRTSAINCFAATVVEIHPGKVNAELRLQIEKNRILTVMVTMQSLHDLAVKKGKRFFVLVPPSQILLALD
ncbi:MAG: TOBE domain-containing protein [Chitinivibrionales bacterium]|nr:TOBE domain-containing protein [Chitinivibrionales bacterium]